MSRKSAAADDAAPKKKKSIYTIASEIAEEVSAEMKIPIVDIDRGTFSEQTWTSGSLTFDMIYGGGWPIGGWVSIMGPSMSGKTTIVVTAIAVAQRLKVPQIVFDHEGSQDPLYGKKIGAIFKKKGAGFHYIQVETGQDTYRFVRRMLKRFPTLSTEQIRKLKQPVCLFIVDSLASMLPDAVADNDENTQPARQAAMHSQYIPLVKKMLSNTGCTLLATNQLRLNPLQRFGNPEVEPGGNAVQFYPDMRIRVSKHAPPKGKNEDEGGAAADSGGGKKLYKQWTEEVALQGDGIDQFLWVSVRTLKNKHFAPFQDAQFRINIGKGLDPIYDGYEYLRLTGQIVTRGGGRYDILLPGHEKEKLSWERLSRRVVTPEFRAACRAQIADGSAFKLYFQVKRQSTEVGEKGDDVLAVYGLQSENDDKKSKKHKTDKQHKHQRRK
jgi:RecA/RadA recombinase